MADYLHQFNTTTHLDGQIHQFLLIPETFKELHFNATRFPAVVLFHRAERFVWLSSFGFNYFKMPSSEMCEVKHILARRGYARRANKKRVFESLDTTKKTGGVIFALIDLSFFLMLIITPFDAHTHTRTRTHTQVNSTIYKILFSS